ncbi:MAG: hypothetical protein OXN84_16180 [Albidovulum sp.]|nr:hypothetical protein [Albidovulum sp.]
MPSWSELLDEFSALQDQEKSQWLSDRLDAALADLASARDTNVVIYASGFLQKPMVPFYFTSITREDINGLMCAMKGLEFSKGLSLILHTPGGDMQATETFVDYLRNKFHFIETIVPVYAMSGGTLIALASDQIVMGKQSQLGPIDPQMPLVNGSASASSILRQFEIAKNEILGNRSSAAAWAPILQVMGPSLLQQAQYALDCGQQMAEQWLKTYMFHDIADAEERAREVAEYLNSEDVHLDHGRRIGYSECEGIGLVVKDLDADQQFQDEILTVYHLLTIGFEQSPAVKIVRNHLGKAWVKSFSVPTP